MLKNYKAGKIIILTTHYMDEADFLGDRIAVMTGGEIQTCGSSMFLKNRFGGGYSLSIQKKTPEKNPALDKHIKNVISTAKVVSNVSTEVTY